MEDSPQMIDLGEFRESNRQALESIAQDLERAGVHFAQVQIPFFSGVIRTKLAPIGEALGLQGEGLNTAAYGLTHGDGQPDGDVLFDGPTVGSDKGWPNITAMADPTTVAQLPWHPDTAAVLIHTFALDGSVCGLDVRALLRRVEERAAGLGFETKVAFEYEAFVYEVDDEVIRSGRIGDLTPYGRHLAVYDGGRAPGFEDLCRVFMSRMDALGASVVAVHTEYGYGMIEFALEPLPVLKAADAAVRAKLVLSELCEERGLVVTFMARSRPLGGESAAGAHLHQSLLRDGENAFYNPEEDDLSEVARHYLAGILATLPELHVIYRPTVNSYRRFDRTAWSPDDASWGYENRYCAMRAITQPAPHGVRFENRVAGADVNPYLVIAASVGAGLWGIEEQLKPPEPVIGPLQTDRFPPLPRRLPESIEAFERSKLARALLGSELTDHYAASRQAEWDAFSHWLDTRITEFEYLRYFESH